MPEEQLDKVKDKIEKLLRLANNNPNIEEAAAAAKQAQRLMTKYSIEQATVRLEEDDGDESDPISMVGSVTVASGRQLASWRTVLANTIAKHNRCRVVLVRYGGFSEMQFVGFRGDMTLCVSMYSLLMPMIDRMAKAYVKTRKAGRGKAKTVGNSYRFGVIHAINDKLKEGNQQEQSDALKRNPKAKQALVRMDDALNIIDRYIGTGNRTKVKNSSMDAAAWHQGRADGKSIDLGDSPRSLGEE